MRPNRAMVMLTREGWGCPGDQELQVDRISSAELSGPPLLRIEEIKNPEDRDDRYELYYAFAGGDSLGLTGSLLVKLRVRGPTASRAGFLQVKDAELLNSGAIRLQLTARVDGAVTADLLYGRSPRMAVGEFACPEADMFDPRPVRFLRVHEVRDDLAVNVEAADGPWRRVEIVVDASMLHEASLVAICEALLDSMEQTLSASRDYTFMWDGTRLTPALLTDLVSRFEQANAGRASLSIDIQTQSGTETFTVGKGQSAPQLSQRIAVRSASGVLAGGRVTIGWEGARASF